MKKAFNQYDTKDAVIDYVDSLSNPRDLLSGDLKIFEDVNQNRLGDWYKSLLKTSQRLENNENNNYANSAAKRDDCHKALDLLNDIYYRLKRGVEEYAPVTYYSIDDSYLEIRQSKYKLSEKEAIKAYYDSLKDPKDLLSGNMGHEIHWKGNESLFNAYIDYFSMELRADQHPLTFVSLEEHAEESAKFAQCKVQCYDMIRTQLEKFYPEIAALYKEHINPEVFDVKTVALGMEKYVETLTNKSDITSGSSNYLPEYLKSYCETLSDATFGIEEFLTEEEFHRIEKQVLNDAYDHYKAITSNVVQEPEPSYSKSDSESLKDYIESLKNPEDFKSGQMELLPQKLNEKYGVLWEMEEAYHTEVRFYHPDEQETYKKDLAKARKEFFTELKEACETYLNDKEIINQQNSDMKEKKTKKSEPKEEKVAKASKQAEPKEEKVAKQAEPKEERKAKKTEAKEEKREPQLVTVNGDKITHAHAFKSNKSEDWFYSVRINGEPLKAKVMDAKDVERVFNDPKGTVQEMMQKYHPTVLMPKVSPAEFKLPKPITTANGEEQIVKFNVYKDNDPNSMSYGKYGLYAQVGDKKMSTEASKQDLDAYFNRVVSPTQLITKNFGDKLGIAAHYEQFKLPEGMNLEGKNILLKKNQETNRYEISVKTPDGAQTRAKELSYDDRQSYFSHKVASKEQLAAKYLFNELSALSMAPKPKVEKQMSLGI